MRYDTIIVGGSFAGLSAALQLARARRRILVIDAGAPRNRYSEAAHGFLGQDGRTPQQIRLDATRQLLAYPTAAVLQGEAVEACGRGDGFAVRLSGGAEHEAARLVLATGVRDELPPIAGIEARWGRSVLHCPYCHGYEARDRALGLLANHAHALQLALMLPDWGPTTYFPQGRFEPSAEEAAQLRARGVRVERRRVVELLGPAPTLEAVRLEDGAVVPVQALFTAPRTSPVSTLAQQIGCALDDGMLGPHLRVDATRQTTVAGVYAAGDAANPMHSIAFAVAAGALAGVAAHRSLVM